MDKIEMMNLFKKQKEELGITNEELAKVMSWNDPKIVIPAIEKFEKDAEDGEFKLFDYQAAVFKVKMEKHKKNKQDKEDSIVLAKAIARNMKRGR